MAASHSPKKRRPTSKKMVKCFCFFCRRIALRPSNANKLVRLSPIRDVTSISRQTNTHAGRHQRSRVLLTRNSLNGRSSGRADGIEIFLQLTCRGILPAPLIVRLAKPPGPDSCRSRHLCTLGTWHRPATN